MRERSLAKGDQTKEWIDGLEGELDFAGITSKKRVIRNLIIQTLPSTFDHPNLNTEPHSPN
ncbi:hypothetical protein PM082_011971 [Marasmius tenuissimus]|nr:hypothetical protein PM082_011971 [Marasmius tenuissimus]